MPKQNIKPYRKYYFLLYFLVFLNIYILKGHGQSLLWRISSEDLKSSSYLYGTIHVKDKRAFEFNDSVLSAFEKCNATALEVDLSAENIVQVAQKMILPDGLTLDSLFTPEEYQIIKSVVEEATGMDISLFNRLKPISLLSLVMNFKFANDMDVSVDEYFYKKAEEHDKQVIGIETIYPGYYPEVIFLKDSIPPCFYSWDSIPASKKFIFNITNNYLVIFCYWLLLQLYKFHQECFLH